MFFRHYALSRRLLNAFLYPHKLNSDPLKLPCNSQCCSKHTHSTSEMATCAGKRGLQKTTNLYRRKAQIHIALAVFNVSVYYEVSA